MSIIYHVVVWFGCNEDDDLVPLEPVEATAGAINVSPPASPI